MSARDFSNINNDFERCDDRPQGFGAGDGDDDDDSAFLDDPVALAAQRPGMDMPAIEKPVHVKQDTHDLVRATMACGAAKGRARDAEVAALREARRAELSKSAIRSAPLLATPVDARAMLATITDAPAATPVVVLVVSDAVAACKKVDRALGLLSARQKVRPADCKFATALLLRLDAAQIAIDPTFGLEIDEAELPALVVYRDGELIYSENNVAIEDADEVEDFLENACGL